jgi:hypothetical protein
MCASGSSTPDHQQQQQQQKEAQSLHKHRTPASWHLQPSPNRVLQQAGVTQKPQVHLLKSQARLWVLEQLVT